eukprot:scaffold39069_cov154-Skeletonema_marinoi.AAC.17
MLSADRCATSAVNKEYVWNGAQKKLCRRVRTNVQIKLSKKEGSQRHGAKRKLSSSKRCVLHLSIKGVCWE